MMNGLDFKEIANAKISSRIKQVGVLLVIIILGIIISVAVNAQSPAAGQKPYKAKFTCMALARKRNQTENIKVSVNYKKVKYRPMAEIEAPASYRTMASQDKRDNNAKR